MHSAVQIDSKRSNFKLGVGRAFLLYFRVSFFHALAEERRLSEPTDLLADKRADSILRSEPWSSNLLKRLDRRSHDQILFHTKLGKLCFGAALYTGRKP